jgi:hypothetical protein
MPIFFKMAINKPQIPAQKQIFGKIFTKNSIEQTFAVDLAAVIRKPTPKHSA